MVQEGGDITEEDKQNFASQFTDIPFNLYKLLPKIINIELVVDNRKRKNEGYIKDIDDNNLTTIYTNNRICLYTQEDVIKYGNEPNGLNSLQKDFVIWLNDGNLSVEKNTIDPTKFILNDTTTSTILNFNTTDIISVIHTTGYFTRSTANTLIVSLTTDIAFLSTLIDEKNEVNEYEGGALEENSSIPLLDTYYDLFFTKDISLDPKTLENNNFLSLVSYFNIFSYYESCLCCDNEEYYQSFNNDNNLEVTNKLTMYVMFKQLLDDFTDKKDKICYGLLEYFLNSGDTKQNYFAVSDDLETVIYYVFSNYKILGTSSNIRINDMITKNQIDINNPIFINTLQYFQELYPKISQKTTEIEDFLTGVNTNSTNSLYIKKYLSIYGFMNMVNDFQDTITTKVSLSTAQIPIEVEETTDNNVAKGVSQYDLVKQKRRREQDEAHAEQLAKIKKGILKRDAGMNTSEQQYYKINPSMINTTPTYVRGGISKKHRKKRTTRRAKKTKKNKKKTIKHKKRQNKTRR